MRRFSPEQVALNAICPYFTMFPLSFPLSVLHGHADENDVAFDPFCGRGTTNFAARLLGLPTIGIDSSSIAVAATAAKLANNVSSDAIVSEARNILSNSRANDVPTGTFWSYAYRPSVLQGICILRESLLDNCRSNTRKALRGVLLGALHGPLHKDRSSSYFSNQAPRTYAPKPRYAVSFWERHGFRAPDVDVVEIIKERAKRYFSAPLPNVKNQAAHGDSRNLRTMKMVCDGKHPRLIITSPPYYGLRTYISDQWIRNWFLGGPDTVDYSYGVQLSHQSVSSFVEDLRRVWRNVASVSHRKARLVFRFGAINDRSVDPRYIIRASLRDTPWRLMTLVDAGTARLGKRQSDSFVQRPRDPLVEFDAWAYRDL
jgi:hypothetical protein